MDGVDFKVSLDNHSIDLTQLYSRICLHMWRKYSSSYMKVMWIHSEVSQVRNVSSINSDVICHECRAHGDLMVFSFWSAVVVTKPPYEITETGWGEFEIIIKIFFIDPNERPVSGALRCHLGTSFTSIFINIAPFFNKRMNFRVFNTIK